MDRLDDEPRAEGGPGADLPPENLARVVEAAARKGPAGAAGDAPTLSLLKQRFERGDIPLGEYLQGLVALRASGAEEEATTSARPDIPAAAVPAAPRGPAPPMPEGPVAPGAPSRDPASAAPAASAPPAAPGLPGLAYTVLGARFELEECVGRGATGAVWRARDLLVDRVDRRHSRVAVKVLHADLHRDPPLLREVLRAAAGMRALQHPGIARVLELQHVDGQYLVVSEWLDGTSLARRLDSPPNSVLPPAEVNRILGAVAGALAHAHRHGIVHGDLKPANVFLADGGEVKLLDFGFDAPGGGQGAGAAPAVPRGVTGVYASCERLEGAKPEPQDDVYALACMAYRMVAGVWPHGTRTALEAEAAGVRPARPEGLTEGQWQALRKGLALRRAERYPGVEPFVADFLAPPAGPRPAAGGDVPAIVAGPAIRPVPPPPAGRVATGRRRRSRGPVTALLLLGVAGALAWLALNGPPPWTRVAAPDPPAPLPVEPPSPPPGPAGMPLPLRPPVAGDETAAAPGDMPPDALPAETGAPAAAVPPPPVPVPEAAPPLPPAPAPVPLPPAEPPVTAAAPPAQAQAPPATPPRPAGPPLIRVPAGQVVVSESDPFVRIRLRLSRPAPAPIDLSVAAVGGAAEAGKDFIAPESPLRIRRGQATADVLVSLIGDSIPENVEDFSIELGVVAGQARLGGRSVVAVLMDDD